MGRVARGMGALGWAEASDMTAVWRGVIGEKERVLGRVGGDVDAACERSLTYLRRTWRLRPGRPELPDFFRDHHFACALLSSTRLRR